MLGSLRDYLAEKQLIFSYLRKIVELNFYKEKRIIKNFLPVAANEKILDIGCGTGKSTEPLIKIFKNAEIVGCDPDAAMLAEAKASAKKLGLPIEYVEGRAERLPFVDDSFDAAAPPHPGSPDGRTPQTAPSRTTRLRTSFPRLT